MTSDPAPRGVILPCGWGRLLFAHTFPDPRDVARVLLEEAPGTRDIAFYVVDPHLILNTAPRDLFMDPSHTFRLKFSNYTPRPEPPTSFEIGPLRTEAEVDEANRIYQAQHMVPLNRDKVLADLDDRRRGFFVARASGTGDILAVALGVDHQLAFQDIENGSSLWSLAVDPQATVPGIGEAMVRHLVEFYRDAGRSQLDLSVLHDNQLAIRLYEKLGFERVPVFAIKRCNPINEKLYTAGGIADEFNPYAQIIIDEAVRRGISIEPVHVRKGYFRLTLGGRSILCRESLSELTSAVAISVSDDKEMTRFLLEEAGLSFPAQTRAGTAEQNASFLAKYERVVVKPARGEQGHGVFVDLRGQEEVQKAVRKAREFSDTVLIEQFVSGEDLRIIVINNEVVAAAVRKPAEVVGTGKHDLQKLIESASRRRAAATGGESTIPIDEETERCLREQGYDLSSVPPADHAVRVRNTANLHTGGTIHDVTPKLHPALAEAAIRAAQVLSMPVVGLDFIVESIEKPGYWVIEANERPGLANHEPQPTAEKFVDLLFPQTIKSPAPAVAAKSD